ncbi:helix-turn-helix domain-containing protein [Pararhodospirillum photometricum]|uniref:helix-turn-helix domain-containing protein n=1 Tax=Pararhodospirillum photometricum TaxID=1084 RepID=UPI0009DA0E12
MVYTSDKPLFLKTKSFPTPHTQTKQVETPKKVSSLLPESFFGAIVISRTSKQTPKINRPAGPAGGGGPVTRTHPHLSDTPDTADTPRGDLPPETVRWLLDRQGLTYADVDRAYGLPEGTCRKAARYPVFAGELALAETLARSPRELWPSRYRADGARRRPQPPANYAPPRRRTTSQKRRDS